MYVCMCLILSPLPCCWIWIFPLQAVCLSVSAMRYMICRFRVLVCNLQGRVHVLDY
ncbi:hypothetical protein L227DRAFT_91110 [Lentinus tigrinus ALCF2SS1-6]|uniref:Uncharacterized protein n=1 Tax=Lentinus tigrinus ALCF2SS1-6 TaxID=1328759 RepID=A0A5C2SGW8_9APHY|nr:hypothetical protein L227DRAFT_91110 [Lentinus tigrinus ALCF2SS1-6]